MVAPIGFTETKAPAAFRTQEEIVAKIKDVEKDDFFGFIRGDLYPFLDYEHAKEFLAADVRAETWNSEMYKEGCREDVLKIMEDYMAFAWDKANNCRGISAARSMDHYTAWMWLIGDDDKVGNLRDYEHYGKDNLRKICELYGWDADQWDDSRRVNSDTE